MTPAEIRQFPMMPGTPELLLRSALTFRRQGQWPGAVPSAQFVELGCDDTFLREYHEVFAFAPATPLLTALYPLAQRAQLALMLEREFPFPIPGVVHLSNNLQTSAEIDWQLPFDLRVQAGVLPDSANGARCLDLVVHFNQRGNDVARCDSRYLVRRGSGPMRRSQGGVPTPTAERSDWSISLADIRRYARVSGDYNPIHLHDWSARLLGAPGAMAHGMYLAGRACAELSTRHSAGLKSLQVEFLRPVRVPTDDPVFYCEAGRFWLQQGGRNLMYGRYEPLA